MVWSIAWESPPPNWMKLNFDGSRKHKWKKATGGFVLRNHRGRVSMAASFKLGNASVLVAECTALRNGLVAALCEGIKWLQIEGDSLPVINAICGTYQHHWSISNLIQDIHELLSCFEEVAMRHVYRQANKVADCAAKLGYFCDDINIWKGRFPRKLWNVIQEDFYGAVIRSSPRCKHYSN